MRPRLEDLLPLASSDGEDESLSMLTGSAHGTSDPRMAPPPAQPPQPTGAAGTTNPGLALLRNYLKWRKLSGAKEDPLQALVGKTRPSLGGTQGADPVSLLSEGGNPFRQITHGANAGQVAQTYELGDGRTANVYYDENGKRRVNTYRS